MVSTISVIGMSLSFNSHALKDSAALEVISPYRQPLLNAFVQNLKGKQSKNFSTIGPPISSNWSKFSNNFDSDVAYAHSRNFQTKCSRKELLNLLALNLSRRLPFK